MLSSMMSFAAEIDKTIVIEEEHQIDAFARSNELTWPTTSKELTSPYGWRLHPIDKIWSFHEGVDIANTTDSDPVWSTGGGNVLHSSNYYGYGNLVVTNFSYGGTYIQTRYAHLHSFSVNKGDTILQGGNVGVMGTTGNSTGIHLHYETREADSMSSLWSGTVHMNPVNLHSFTGSQLRTNSRIFNKEEVIVGKSDHSYGYSKGDRFYTVEYIIDAETQRLLEHGITSTDIETLIKEGKKELDKSLSNLLEDKANELTGGAKN